MRSNVNMNDNLWLIKFMIHIEFIYIRVISLTLSDSKHISMCKKVTNYELIEVTV